MTIDYSPPNPIVFRLCSSTHLLIYNTRGIIPEWDLNPILDNMSIWRAWIWVRIILDPRVIVADWELMPVFGNESIWRARGWYCASDCEYWCCTAWIRLRVWSCLVGCPSFVVGNCVGWCWVSWPRPYGYFFWWLAAYWDCPTRDCCMGWYWVGLPCPYGYCVWRPWDCPTRDCSPGNRDWEA